MFDNDITKCKDETCPKKETCYRYLVKEDMMQSYFLNSPRDGDECEYYWKTDEVDK